MPKKREATKDKPADGTREKLPRAAHDKKRGPDGLFNSWFETPKKKKRSGLAKKKATKKKKTPLRKSKPTYLVMIRRVLAKLNDRGGSSLFSIYKTIEETYPVSDGYRRYVSSALKQGIENGVFDRIALSYKLTSKGRNQGKRKKKKKSTTTTKTKKKKTSGKRKIASKSKGSKKRKTTSTKKKKSTTTKKKKKEPKKKAASKGSRASSFKRSGEKAAAVAPAALMTITPAGHKFKWQYQDGAWKDYEINASDVVEGAYQGYIKNPGMCDVRSIKSGQWQYQVDFLNMKQTNIQHEGHTVRSIRRSPL